MNINAALQSYGMEMSRVPKETGEHPAGKPADARINANTSETDNSVHLSAQGKALSGLPPLLLPTRENVQKLSAALSDSLNELFSEAGISSDPAVEFDVDSYTGKVSVRDNRPDAQKIAKLLKENTDIELQIHNIAAISSHVVAIAQAMDARASHYQAAKYASQNKVTDFMLIFNGENVQVNADGAAWLTSVH